MAASTVLSTKGSIDQGNAEKASAEFQAKTQLAAGTQKAYESRREADILASNARAAMAGSGGSASDAGAIEELSRIAQEGAYNSQSDIYKAETNADITRYEGKLKKYASQQKALGTVLSGASNLYQMDSFQDWKRKRYGV